MNRHHDPRRPVTQSDLDLIDHQLRSPPPRRKPREPHRPLGVSGVLVILLATGVFWAVLFGLVAGTVALIERATS